MGLDGVRWGHHFLSLHVNLIYEYHQLFLMF